MPRIRAASIPEHKAKTREDLLTAAFRLFAQHGYAGTRLTDVAELAGVGRTTFYDYFPNKTELFLALMEDRVPPRLEAMIASLPEGSPADRLEALFHACFDLVVAEIDLARVLFVVGRELPAAARDRMWDVLAPASEELLRECEEGFGRETPAPGEVELVHRAVADMLVGGVDQVLANKDVTGSALRVCDARLRFVLGGLRPPGRPSGSRPAGRAS